MTKPIPAQETFADLSFPTQGIDISHNFEEQRQGTTPTGINVRAFEPDTQRARGGARPGIIKYLGDPVIAGAQIQHLNFIVDPQEAALGWSFDDDPGDDDDIEDPTIPTFFLADGSINDIFPGGSGYSTSPLKKRKNPKVRIIANNKVKIFGNTLVFTGTEFTAQGLKVGDTVTSANIISAGSGPGAAVGSYPIVISNAIFNITNLGHNPYRVKYVNGTLMVKLTSIQLVQETGFFNSAPLSFASNVTAGHLLIAITSTAYPVPPGPFPLTVTDSLGNSYTQAVRVSVQNASLAGYIEVAIWYCISAFSGACTINVTSGGNFLNALEFSGVNAVPLDGTSSNSGSIAPNPLLVVAPWDTNNVSVLANDMVIFAFGTLGVGTQGPTTDPEVWISENFSNFGVAYGSFLAAAPGTVIVSGTITQASTLKNLVWGAVAASFKSL